MTRLLRFQSTHILNHEFHLLFHTGLSDLVFALGFCKKYDFAFQSLNLLWALAPLW